MYNQGIVKILIEWGKTVANNCPTLFVSICRIAFDDRLNLVQALQGTESKLSKYQLYFISSSGNSSAWDYVSDWRKRNVKKVRRRGDI